MSSIHEHLENQHNIAEIQLIYKTKVKAKDRPQIHSSQDASEIFKQHFSNETIELYEEFKILLLNRANKALGLIPISIGGTSGCIVDIKFIVAAACKANASGVILCHNHPSGNLTPSTADIQLTKKIKEILDLLSINLLDHLIITTDSYTSLADECCF